jgi:hypothetical protein
MSSKVKVQCPCCKSVLVVDRQTGVVLSHEEQKSKTKSLEDFLEEEKTKMSRLDEKFKENIEKEKNKFEALDAKFKHAKENKDKLKDPPPGVMWD